MHIGIKPKSLQAVRLKRGAAAKDVIPDESFLRLRGALFFGPGFLVTRNKLTFRDNLQDLLRAAIPSEKAINEQNSSDTAMGFEILCRLLDVLPALITLALQKIEDRKSYSKNGLPSAITIWTK